MVALARLVQSSDPSTVLKADLMVARGGSQHIEFLLKNKLVHAMPSKMLEIAYAEAKMKEDLRGVRTELSEIASEKSNKPVSKAPKDEEKMLLSESSGQLIADYLEVPELAVEIQRAVWQVDRALKAKQEYQEEKKELGSATKKPDEKS